MDARRARKELRAFASAWLRGIALNDFESAAGEVLANAVEHGRGTTLSISCRYADGAVIAEVAHDGVGFLPPAEVGAPPHGSMRGYGLFIVYKVIDEVAILDGGRRVRLIKRVIRR